MRIKTHTMGNFHAELFEKGGLLFGADPNTVGMNDYTSPRAQALYQALGADQVDEEYQIAELPDGRWALIGLTGDGQAFAIETK